MFCLCGLVIQKPTREYCIFGKRFSYDIQVLRSFGKLPIYATRDLGLEEKSITSYPHWRDS